MASNEDARAAREAKLDQLHEKLTGAVEALVSGDDWRQALAFAARFRSRSFNNTMLIWVQHEAAFEAGRVPEPFPTLVAGYRQWQGLGRQVMKGQVGYMIFAPVIGRFATATPADAGSWRRLGPREKPKAGEVVRSRMVGARPAYVWDASQTDGEPLPLTPTPTLLEGEAPAGLWERGWPGRFTLLGSRCCAWSTRAGSSARTVSPTTRHARSRCGRTWTLPRRSRPSRTSWRMC